MATSGYAERSVSVRGSCEEWFAFIMDSFRSQGHQNIIADDPPSHLTADSIQGHTTSKIAVSLCPSCTEKDSVDVSIMVTSSFHAPQ